MFFSLATALPLLHNEPLFPQGKHAAWLEGADPNRPQARPQARPIAPPGDLPPRPLGGAPLPLYS